MFIPYTRADEERRAHEAVFVKPFADVVPPGRQDIVLYSIDEQCMKCLNMKMGSR